MAQQCFNTAGLFNTGVQFLGTFGMDNGNNCTPTPPYTNCPDAYSANQLGLSTSTPPTLTPTSVNVPFTFGAVNTANCGPATSVSCTLNVVNLTSSGVAITLPVAQQVVYSTVIVLGTAVNGHHSGTVTANYTDGSSTVFNQTFSDWCGFGGNQYESVAVGGINRLNADGTLNGASCNLYCLHLPGRCHQEFARDYVDGYRRFWGFIRARNHSEAADLHDRRRYGKSILCYRGQFGHIHGNDKSTARLCGNHRPYMHGFPGDSVLSGSNTGDVQPQPNLGGRDGRRDRTSHNDFDFHICQARAGKFQVPNEYSLRAVAACPGTCSDRSGIPLAGFAPEHVVPDAARALAGRTHRHSGMREL